MRDFCPLLSLGILERFPEEGGRKEPASGVVFSGEGLCTAKAIEAFNLVPKVQGSSSKSWVEEERVVVARLTGT